MAEDDTRGSGPIARPSENPHRGRVGLIAYLAVLLAGAASIALYADLRRPEGGTNAPRTAPSLSPDHPVHRFGDVRADGAGVETEFALTNTGPTSVVLADVYTSCACVTATLRFPDGTTEGPFGVKGHGPAPLLSREVGPGASFTVTVRLDPSSTDPRDARNLEYHVRIHTENGGAMATLTVAAPPDGSTGPGEEAR